MPHNDCNVFGMRTAALFLLFFFFFFYFRPRQAAKAVPLRILQILIPVEGHRCLSAKGRCKIIASQARALAPTKGFPFRQYSNFFFQSLARAALPPCIRSRTPGLIVVQGHDATPSALHRFFFLVRVLRLYCRAVLVHNSKCTGPRSLRHALVARRSSFPGFR